MKFNENQWNSMEINEIWWKQMKFDEIQWTSMKFNENQWNLMKINEIRWKQMRFNENQWNSMNKWNSTEIYEIQCNSTNLMNFYIIRWRSMKFNEGINIYYPRIHTYFLSLYQIGSPCGDIHLKRSRRVVKFVEIDIWSPIVMPLFAMPITNVLIVIRGAAQHGIFRYSNPERSAAEAAACK